MDVMEELEDAVRYITKEPTKDKLLFEKSLRTVTVHAQSRGLLHNQINQLICYIGSCRKGGAWVNSFIIRALIPATTVPSSAVVKAICYVGLKRTAMNTKVLLLKWILLIYNLIDDLSPLRSLYGVILNHIVVDELRSLICQLLIYLTQQGDVKPYRAQRLLQIRKRVGDELALNALLGIYQLYAPYLVPITIKTQCRKLFNNFEKTLAANIAKVQKLQSAATPSLMVTGYYPTMGPPETKRMRKELDELFPQQLVNLRHQKNSFMTPLTTFSELADNVDVVEFPNQMATILQYPVMQQLLVITADPAAPIRLTNWLQGFLLTKVIETRSNTVVPWIKKLLQNLVSLSHMLLEPIPIVELFIADYLQSWDGCAYQKEILQLVSCSLHLQDYDDLRNDFLDPLKKLIFISNSTEFKFTVLQSFTELLRHFVVIEWPRFHRYLQQGDEFDSVFMVEYPDGLNPKNVILGFISYVDDMLIHCLQDTQDDPFIQAVAGDFHCLVATLPCEYGVPVFVLPRAEFHFRNLFSLNGMAIVLACNHLLNFKRSLDVARQWPVVDRVSTGVVKQFNCVVLDFCNALWRCLVFTKERQSTYDSLGFPFSREYLTETCKIKDPLERLHITQHTALLGYVNNFLSKIQQGSKQIHPALITHQGEIKQAYFNYLVLNHMDGIVNFISTFTAARTL